MAACLYETKLAQNGVLGHFLIFGLRTRKAGQKATERSLELAGQIKCTAAWTELGRYREIIEDPYEHPFCRQHYYYILPTIRVVLASCAHCDFQGVLTMMAT